MAKEEPEKLLLTNATRDHLGTRSYWSCQLAFDSTQFDKLIPWLEEHRAGLNVLVHPATDNHLEDHTTHASWLGKPAKLNLEVFGG